MRYEEWEPHYHDILDYFGFDPALDETAAELLSDLITDDAIHILRNLIAGKVVTVAGNAPVLASEIDRIEGTLLAADAAALVLQRHGIIPDAIFTDLDGAEEPFISMNKKGTLIVVHAHGDNMPLLSRWVPAFTGPLVGTTQGPPRPKIHNFGGFTDGDRAVFAADALGAKRIVIIGFDLSDSSVDPMKKGKLLWARRLLGLLGYEI